MDSSITNCDASTKKFGLSYAILIVSFGYAFFCPSFTAALGSTGAMVVNGILFLSKDILLRDTYEFHRPLLFVLTLTIPFIIMQSLNIEI